MASPEPLAVLVTVAAHAIVVTAAGKGSTIFIKYLVMCKWAEQCLDGKKVFELTRADFFTQKLRMLLD